MRGDEGRAKLRKAWGSCTEAMIPGCPNGATHMREPHVPTCLQAEQTW